LSSPVPWQEVQAPRDEDEDEDFFEELCQDSLIHLYVNGMTQNQSISGMFTVMVGGL